MFYKMALYDRPDDKVVKFTNETIYPEFPHVKPMESQKEYPLSLIYQIVVQHIKSSIEKYFI